MLLTCIARSRLSVGITVTMVNHRAEGGTLQQQQFVADNYTACKWPDLLKLNFGMTLLVEIPLFAVGRARHFVSRDLLQGTLPCPAPTMIPGIIGDCGLTP